MSAASTQDSQLLICVTGPDSGKRIAVTPKTAFLGRSSTCEMASDDPEVSERHASLELKDGKIFFAGLGEAALYLDGRRVQQGTIEARQQLRIGRSVWRLETAGQSNGFSSFLGSLGDKISEVAGAEKIEGFNLSEMFSEIWRHRDDEEMENYFAVGTPFNTPRLAEVDANWPKPWFFFKTFTLAALVYLGFLFGFQEFHNVKLIPGLLVIGSFVMPLTLLILFFEINVLRNVPIYQVLKLSLLGGILSLVLSLFLYQWTRLGTTPTWFGALGVGLVEETGKVAALLLVLDKLKYRWVLNGMLFGAAVGAGFAGFESAGFALLYFRYGLNIITTRGLLCILGGHVLWCALEGAALWRVRGDRKFDWPMLSDLRFLRVFGLCVVMHMVWDAPWNLPLFLKYIALGFVVWVAILSFIQLGLRQIRSAQIELARQETPPEAN